MTNDSLCLPCQSVPCQIKIPLTSLHFHILKKEVVWLGKFSFSTMLLNLEYTNMTKSGDVCEENTWNPWAAISLEICG